MVKFIDYVPGRLFDPILEKIIKKSIAKNIDKKDDDFMIFCTGTTGTGKSSLMMHVFECYDFKGCDIKYIGLNKKDHSNAMLHAKNKKKLRFCCYDEANVSRRDHMQKYNKEIIQLFFQIRGLKIFHWWNNPSLDVLEKTFIEERIKGVIYIFTKNTNSPRLYYYFTKSALLKIWEKEKKLTHRFLDKHKELALYRGWFKPYKGKLWEDYVKKKDTKMDLSVDQFYEKYGQETYNKSAAAKILKIAPRTFFNYYKDNEESLIDGLHIIRGKNGFDRITEKGINFFNRIIGKVGNVIPKDAEV